MLTKQMNRLILERVLCMNDNQMLIEKKKLKLRILINKRINSYISIYLLDEWHVVVIADSPAITFAKYLTLIGRK
jgi:hypothetical protein